ncbi:NAD(P)H-hydrate epimerase [uncultured Demequina sp.]|uniref:NAD(P)H-hydrate epimerase n=1 Tax=uncultured Demequina sp. TaxID=693499 RepID=UPI0025F620A8|nr:NAD(P)H-hydrate epimerase [uncultured Demequina sp.]
MTSAVMTSDQVRAAETRAMRTVSERTLMARAADAVAAEAEALLAREVGRIRGSRVTVLAGSGSNGGDAMLAGARLHYRGAETTVVLVGPSAHPDGLGEALAAGAAVIDAGADLDAARTAVSDAHLVVDGIVGIGGRPGLREPAASVVAAVSAATTVLAVDVPSGVGVDTGAVGDHHVHADVTVTFTVLKPCLVEDPAAASAGRVVVADVGVPRL